MPNSERRAEAKCQRCGYVWYPNRKFWKSKQLTLFQGRKVKVLFCPMCNARVRIAKGICQKLLAVSA